MHISKGLKAQSLGISVDGLLMDPMRIAIQRMDNLIIQVSDLGNSWNWRFMLHSSHWIILWMGAHPGPIDQLFWAFCPVEFDKMCAPGLSGFGAHETSRACYASNLLRYNFLEDR